MEAINLGIDDPYGLGLLRQEVRVPLMLMY